MRSSWNTGIFIRSLSRASTQNIPALDSSIVPRARNAKTSGSSISTASLHEGRIPLMDRWKAVYAQKTDKRVLADVIPGADIFLGLSARTC